jgi:hypothetical protein
MLREHASGLTRPRPSRAVLRTHCNLIPPKQDAQSAPRHRAGVVAAWRGPLTCSRGYHSSRYVSPDVPDAKLQQLFRDAGRWLAEYPEERRTYQCQRQQAVTAPDHQVTSRPDPMKVGFYVTGQGIRGHLCAIALAELVVMYYGVVDSCVQMFYLSTGPLTETIR